MPDKVRYQPQLTVLDILLEKLKEEPAELIQVACKATLHGLDDDHRGETNREAIERELGDVLAIAKLLDSIGAINLNRIIDGPCQAKVQKLITICRENGLEIHGQ